MVLSSLSLFAPSMLFVCDRMRNRTTEVQNHIPQESQRVNLKGRVLQVIVKAAEIVLTPEKPVYPGRSIHCAPMTRLTLLDRWLMASGRDEK